MKRGYTEEVRVMERSVYRMSDEEISQMCSFIEDVRVEEYGDIHGVRQIKIFVGSLFEVLDYEGNTRIRTGELTMGKVLDHLKKFKVLYSKDKQFVYYIDSLKDARIKKSRIVIKDYDKIGRKTTY